MNRIQKIISGGQTGVDQAALRVGAMLNIKTGGWMPRGFRTEDGPRPDFEKLYGMTATKDPGYPVRTKRNVVMSDGTVIMGHLNSPGSILTVSCCVDAQIPFLKINHKINLMEAVKKIRLFIVERNISTLNVAGNRENSYPGVGAWAELLLFEALKREDQIVN